MILLFALSPVGKGVVGILVFVIALSIIFNSGGGNDNDKGTGGDDNDWSNKTLLPH